MKTERKSAAQISPARAIANTLNAQHEKYSAGFYSSLGGRFFAARVQGDGTLQISDFDTWRDVETGEWFRDHNGRDITAPMA